MIRIAKKDDLDKIYDLNCELFNVLSNLREDIYNPIGLPKVFINSMIISNDSDYILIEDDDKIVGYSLIEKRCSPVNDGYECFKEDNFAFVHEIVVLPEYRNKGYGTQMIEEAKKWAKDRNLNSIELNVLANNYSAIAFYEQKGFKTYQVKYRSEI